MTGGNRFFTPDEIALHAEVEGFCPPDEPSLSRWDRLVDRLEARREKRMLAALAARARGEEDGQ